MARKSLIEDVFDIVATLPWWVGVILGGAFFYAFKVYIPESVSDPLKPAWTPMFDVLAWAFLGLCLLAALTSFIRRLRDKRLFDRQSSIESIRNLSWSQFERFVLEAYRRQGYDASETGAGADGGVDIILKKDGKTTLVQCKQWKTQRIGVKPIRELAGVVAVARANRGIFVCSGSYTAEAKEFAAKSGIELIDGEALTVLLAEIKGEPEGDRVPPTANVCPRCGSDLVRRVARRGSRKGEAFLGCSAFPKCRYSRNL
ncbi:MAG TPA: restriction endonuclease [Woeseiaceae bacterium]|nr:restriction endonuclease [Woeseiaceae bacterium]